MFKIGDLAVVTNPAFISGAFGKTGIIQEFDTDIHPGEVFAVMDIDGTEYCFNINDLSAPDEYHFKN